MSTDELLKVLSQSISITQKGKTTYVDWTTGMDHTKELAEIALQFIDIVVHHKVLDNNEDDILGKEPPTKIDNILKRQIPTKTEIQNNYLLGIT